MAIGNYNKASEAYEKALDCAPTDIEIIKENKLCKLVFLCIFLLVKS